jgi:hypothetical protein
MNERQIDGINKIMDFLNSSEFKLPYNLEELVKNCNRKIHMLEFRRVDDEIIKHFTEICEKECNKYI